jgi:hypothetical protein
MSVNYRNVSATAWLGPSSCFQPLVALTHGLGAQHMRVQSSAQAAKGRAWKRSFETSPEHLSLEFLLHINNRPSPIRPDIRAGAAECTAGQHNMSDQKRIKELFSGLAVAAGVRASRRRAGLVSLLT